MNKTRGASRSLDAQEVQQQLRRAWSAESSSLWSSSHPARGQCNVTALVVHDHFGGEILKTRVGREWHFYNRIDGRTYDFTADQFSEPPEYRDIPSNRAEALAGTTPSQYESLARRFRALAVRHRPDTD